MNANVTTEMPKYRAHKEVHALKIAALDQASDGTTVLVPEDRRYAPFALSPEYVVRHRPQVGGYFVVYKDGYQSWSPAQAFEEGYTLIQE